MGRKIWTMEDMQLLKVLYPDTLTSELALKLDTSERSIYYMAGNLGLKKTEAYLIEHGGRLKSDTGIGSRYPKGHVPFNKNKKVTEYMDSDQIERMLKTSYKKGNVPHNTKGEVGTISQRVHKKCGVFLVIKIGLGQWEYLSNYNYKKHFGPIPKGYVVSLRDKNPLNCDPENLELITRKENMLRNSITNLPPEIRANIKVINKLNKTINKLEKQYGTK